MHFFQKELLTYQCVIGITRLVHSDKRAKRYGVTVNGMPSRSTLLAVSFWRSARVVKGGGL